MAMLPMNKVWTFGTLEVFQFTFTVLLTFLISVSFSVFLMLIIFAVHIVVIVHCVIAQNIHTICCLLTACLLPTVKVSNCSCGDSNITVSPGKPVILININGKIILTLYMYVKDLILCSVMWRHCACNCSTTKTLHNIVFFGETKTTNSITNLLFVFNFL